MPYTILTKETVAPYLMKHDETRKILDVSDEKEIEVKEIGDGNLNLVFAVTAKKGKLIVKQALPYLRCAGEGFPLAKERMHYEIRALKKAGELAPKHVPKVHLADEEMCLVVMQYLDRHIIMRKGLIECQSYPHFSDHISTYLAETLFKTSSLCLDSKKKAELINKFNSNELRELTEKFVFTNPFMPHETNKVRPALQKEAEALWSDSSFKTQVLSLKNKFMNETEALIHGDLHTGSIMANQDETYVIDPEFAYVGPFGFDLGAVLGNLIMSWVSHFERSKNSDYQENILTMIQEVLTQFENKFLALWNKHLENPLVARDFLSDIEMAAYQKSFMQQILRDAVGFAGCKISRRQLGIAGVADIREIPDDKAAARAETMALAIGKKLVISHQTFNEAKDVIGLLRIFSEKFYPTHNHSYQAIMSALGVTTLMAGLLLKSCSSKKTLSQSLVATSALKGNVGAQKDHGLTLPMTQLQTLGDQQAEDKNTRSGIRSRL